MGGIGALMPNGISDMKDLPFNIFDAIVQGMFLLDLQELPDDERPSREVMEDPKRLNAHITRILAERKRKTSSDSQAPPDSDPVTNPSAHLLGID